MSVLSTLIEQADKARAERDAFRAEHRGLNEAGEETREFSPEEELRFVELDEVVVKLEDRIAEVNAEELRKGKVEEARKRVIAPAVVREEARTYGPESPDNSYYSDMVKVAMGPGVNGWKDALARQERHGLEMVRDAVNDREARNRVIKSVKTNYREDSNASRRIVADLESRAMDTGGTSGGSFVTPQYLVDDYAPYVQYNRGFADAANKNELPDYGMTIYLPQVQSPSAVAAQGSQNSGVTETDPTAGYLQSNLNTIAGQVVISQQLLDRAGPGIQFDKIVFDSLNRNYNQTFDAALLTTVLGTSGILTVTGSGTAPTTGAAAMQAIVSGIGSAAAQMETAQGTVLSPTHAFVTGTQAGSMGAMFDSYGRPYLANQPQNSPLSGADNADAGAAEAPTGWNLGGLPIIKDSNLKTAAGGEGKILVAHAPEIWYWEGDLVPRTIPQTYAQNLSILLQVYTYWTVIVRYPKAVAVVSGTSIPTTPLFPGF